jgi:8-oxo-dGTP diphosphatase
VHFTEYDTRVAAYAAIVDEQDRILLAWWNGEGRSEPGWSLPGGGVEFEESLVEGVVREVREETGYDVEVGDPLVTDFFTRTGRGDRADGRSRPFKAVRFVFDAVVVGGELGTLEVGGSTDFAQWVPLAEVAAQPTRSRVVDVAVSAWRRRHRPDMDHR